MQRSELRIFLAVVTLMVVLPACRRPVAPAATQAPAHIEAIDGSSVSRVVLTPRAVERLGIETRDVRRTSVTRTWVVAGEVMASSELTAGAADTVLAAASDRQPASLLAVRASLETADLGRLDLAGEARVVSLRSGSAGAVVNALPVTRRGSGERGPAFYLVQGGGQGLVLGERVQVHVPTVDSGTVRSVVPFGAIVYDVQGASWVYTNPEPNTYVRAPVTVDFVEDGVAVLREDMPEGLAVVSVGAAELLGTEFGVGH